MAMRVRLRHVSHALRAAFGAIVDERNRTSRCDRPVRQDRHIADAAQTPESSDVGGTNSDIAM